MIETTPSADDKASTAEVILNGFNALCNTTAAGDDVQLVQPNTVATPGQLLITAGLNGKIDTPPAGDDYVRSKHEFLCATNPLVKDTDADGIPDGRELLLGTNPNAKDAGRVIDSDGDGLYDDEEDAGWDVVVYNASGTPATTHVTSNKVRADTDLDGVSDLYEWAIRSNPRSEDTDGDTLFDSREFDPDDTDHYYNASLFAEANRRCGPAEHCDAPQAPSISQRLRTNLWKVDSDGDTLTDTFEVNQGWSVSVEGEAAYQVRFAGSLRLGQPAPCVPGRPMRMSMV